jgi:carbonic anhydrase
MHRRRFIRTTATSVVAGSLPWPIVTTHRRQTPATPEAALQELAAGNQRFVANHPTSIAQNLEILKAKTVDQQHPFAAVLGCADSRVPVELVFDQSIGELFVTRVAGNLATPEIIASLEYGVAVLGVKAVLVLGHANCGAVKASMKAEEVPGQISSLYPHIRPAIDRSGGSIDRAIAANAQFQCELLRTSSTVMRDALTQRKIDVRSAVYDLATGKVTLL